MGTELWGCAKHAAMGPTCCQTSEVMVTEGDKARITAHLATSGERIAAWWRATPPTDAYADDGSDPAWSLGFHPDGSRPTLVRGADGTCVFLGAAGCRLPVETRPLICRLYPYQYDEGGFTGISDRCPKEVVPPGKSILEVLEMNESDARRWHEQLYRELRAAPRR